MHVFYVLLKFIYKPAIADLAVGYYLQKSHSEPAQQALILAIEKDAETAVVSYMKVCF